MKRLVSTLNLSKEDWLRYRKCGITGTDAGAILGLNPYRSAFQVYHDKISDTIENIDNEAMRQLPNDGRRYIDEETDWNYDPFGGAEKNQKPCVTVEEFMNQYLNR